MGIPKEIKIGGYDYTVSMENSLSRDNNAFGMSCGNAQTIKIDATLPKQNQESTLLHEIIEQINFRYELRLPHEQITILESALYQVLKDNKLSFE
ncbi:hypothetical protein [Anaerosolibacter sp.]|uniref:hypothetical protein n=1 Tax=Anaerosolibacter sp. TaxID=1872527 RepID=UPI0039EEF3D3